MNAITIAIANQKGGVAKTTSTICLGGLLSDEANCLAIDLDPQGNLSTGLGIELPDDAVSCYDIITEQARANEVIVSTNSGLDLIPADITLAKGETEILTKVGNFYILKERLEPVLSDYSHILIDCPPSLGLLTINALSAADVVLIPVQCQFFALKGLASLLETITSVRKRLNPRLQILGILPTMAENTVMSRDVISSLQQRFPDTPVLPPVPKSVQFTESNLAGEPIHTYTDQPKLVYPYRQIVSLIQSQTFATV
ncbi:MAG: ParA family protein [Waterburya sp.]